MKARIRLVSLLLTLGLVLTACGPSAQPAATSGAPSFAGAS